MSNANTTPTARPPPTTATTAHEQQQEEAPATARLTLLHQSVQAHPQDSSLRFDLALLLWEIDSKDQAAEQFLISAKLDPHNALAFRYLGHYHSPLDSQRALKCYHRAVTLKPDDSESGEPLCHLLHQARKDSLQLAICKEASQNSPRAFWAFRRLGFLHLRHNSCSEAVQALQHAIPAYPTSADLWQALGLAYQRLGMFTAATKSYGRAIELDQTSVFALVESGHIFLMLGSFRKSIEHFRRALDISPQNFSANYGLASGLLFLAKECSNLGAFRWAASLLEDACKVANSSTCMAGNVSCIWKLYGDIQLTYAKCFPWMEKGQSVEFDVDGFRASILSWKQTRLLAAISARRSYQRALRLAPCHANLYIDIAIASDLISSMNEDYEYYLHPWHLPEKMALGALSLEGDNHEFWVALGFLSGHNASKQHALIRGLQLDVSSAIAWAYLGKLYREEGENKLARQAFDCARSIDPSLALPWAGMSADTNAREPTADEAFESCLRAAQILPLAEFQIGLAKLALLSGHLASPQVFVAIQQAVQRAPDHPASHNLNGLVCEARSEYQAAVTSFKLACYTISISSCDAPKSYIRDVTVNLVRSLSKAGHASEAVQECENLKKNGVLDVEGMQIYAFSLWQLGRNDLVPPVARMLAASVSAMEKTTAAVSVGFICQLLYYISGIDSAITSILKMPKQLCQSSKVSFIASAINALDQSNRLESYVSSSHYSPSSHEEVIERHYLIALTKLVKYGSESCLGFHSGISHLKKALHVYPNSNLIRSLLGHLLISSEEWKETHAAIRCCIIDTTYGTCKEGLKSGFEILGAGAVACYAIGTKDPKFSFPTCGYQCLNGPNAVHELQRYLRQEPWNHNAQYLLILNLLQKAREERFPSQMCISLKRLIIIALSHELYSRESMFYQYPKFQLLLCASEISLQRGNENCCIKYAKNASSLLLPSDYLFFGHLMLCRAYAAGGNYTNLKEEHTRCLELKTDYHIGWICLKILESQYDVQTDSSISGLRFKECLVDWKSSWNMWMAAFNLVLGLTSLWNEEYFSAEESLAQACSLAGVESCLFLCHGTICMELARQFSSSHFLSRAIRSLTKAHVNSTIPLPIVSLLLAQAEGSLGSKEKWEKNLRLEWYSWPPEMRPAELFLQMHLLARQLGARFDCSSDVEFCQSPEKWVLRAIHTNPSCLRYWKILQKLME